jgi:squalene synthase HpnC
MAVDHYENFPVASPLLPARFRRPVALIYRFARTADDFADEGDAPPDERLRQLDTFYDELLKIDAGLPPAIPWFAELAEVIRQHRLPTGLFRDLLSAFAQDVTKSRYATYAEVLDYSRRSANPVGRLLLVLYGAASPENLLRSDAICTSLQIINFIQDVAVDYRNGRVYMPQDELNRFGVTEDQLARGDPGGPWPAFVQFQIARTRSLLYSGAPLGRALRGRIGLELRTIIQGGDRIMEKIAGAGGDVFHRRPVLRWHDWPLMLARAAL